jgi:aspartate/methionine/tyrosine aminotransferase
LSFGDSGELENLSEAPNDGKVWSKEDSNKLLEMNSAGITLNGMSKTFGRTKLAIGWRLADQRELRNIG